ncbi:MULTISPECIES: tautomerase family protein [Pseudoalteromonas]|uniref:tautomerase family protein n=1 Tax=unclassified Pseudoalteromonas TaxID=194690 RepID=UPI001FFD7AED|nr:MULTISPECIES: tautomerase family protein [Pseudoalteromonas]
MPHINIHYFDSHVSSSTKNRLVKKISALISKEFKCNNDFISIALHAEQPKNWQQRVYNKHIIQQKHKLIKKPNY